MQRLVRNRYAFALLFAVAAVACSAPRRDTATVRGTVLTADGRPAPGLHAALPGTPASSSTDAGGAFSLAASARAVSALRLTGPGVDGSLSLPALHSGLVVSVAVRLGDGGVRLDGEMQASLRGAVSALHQGALDVGDCRVLTDASTQVLAGAAAIHIGDLRSGEVIDVSGVIGKDGCVLARTIHAGSRDDKIANQAEVKGTISALLPPDSLVVAGTTVHTTSTTSIEVNDKKASFASLAVGQQAEVKGTPQADKSILATEVESEGALPAPAPIANAGAAQSVTSGALVTLDGSASTDPAGLPLTYAWTQVSGPAVALAGAATAKPTFTAPFVAFGSPAASLVFSLVVSDANASSAPATVTITVNAAIPPPIANAGANQTVASGALVTLDGTASTDPAGLPLTFSWTQSSGPAVTLAGAATATPSFTAPTIAFDQPGVVLGFTLVVSDASGSSAPSSVNVTVSPLPPPPPPIANAGANQTVASGAQVTLDGTGSTDPAGLPLSYAWSQVSGPVVTLAGATTANPTFTAPSIAPGLPAALLVFSLTVNDANFSSQPSTVTITVNPLPPPPIASAGPDQAVDSGALVALDGSGSSDPAGLPLTYSWSQTAGPIVALSDATVVSPTFTAPTIASGQPPAVLTFSLTVSDANGSSAPATVNVTVNPQPPPNLPPVANAGPDQSVASAAAVTLDGRGSFDPEAEALTFAWTQSSGPAVTLAFADTAQPSFTAPAVPSGSPAATLVFSLVVSDPAASSTPATVTITVNPEATAFPPPPGTPPSAPAGTVPLPAGGSGSNRFQVGAANGLYLQDPATGEPSVQGFVVVTLSQISNGSFDPPPDTVVTLNGVALLRDPNLNGSFFRLDPAGPQPVVGTGGQMVIVASGTVGGKLVQRQLVLPCPSDIEVASTPPVGSVITGLPSIHLTSPSDITFNVGVPAMASIFPQAQLFGYDRATRTLAPSGTAVIIAPGPLDVTVPVTSTAADAYLMDLRWPGTWIIDGETGGFCGLAKRWAYAK